MSDENIEDEDFMAREKRLFREYEQKIEAADAAVAEVVNARRNQLIAQGIEVLASTTGGILYVSPGTAAEVSVEVFNGDAPADHAPETYRQPLAKLTTGSPALIAKIMDPPGDQSVPANTYAEVVLVLASADVDHLKVGGDFPGERKLTSALIGDSSFRFFLDGGYGWEDGQKVNGRNADRERIAGCRLRALP